MFFRLLEENPSQVYSSATDLLRFVTETYVVEHGLQSKMATRVATATADPLVSRTGDTTVLSFFYSSLDARVCMPRQLLACTGCTLSLTVLVPFPPNGTFI